MAVPLSSHEFSLGSGYSGNNITRFDWIDEYIGIKDDSDRGTNYVMWNYDDWNSETDYPSNRSIFNQIKSENFIYLRENEPFRDDFNQVDVAWSLNNNILAQAFTFSDDGPDIIYITNRSNLTDIERENLTFNEGNILSMNWGSVNNTDVLFIGTSDGEIWSWNSNNIQPINLNSSSMSLEHKIEEDGSIQYLNTNSIQSSTIAGIQLIDGGNDLIILNSSATKINTSHELGPISQGKWNYNHQFQFYYSIIGFSDVIEITGIGNQIEYRIYHALNYQLHDSKSFQFSFSETFELFGTLADNKIQIYNITSGIPSLENLIYEYQEDGVPIDSFAIHPFSPLVVFNLGLPNLNSEKYESAIIVANIYNKKIEYSLVPTTYKSEQRYPSIEVTYAISLGIITFVIVMKELTIRSKLRKEQKFLLKKEIITKRAEGLYPEK